MGIHDAPYNVRIQGNVGGRGRIKRQEFVCASGEMSSTQFTGFLRRRLATARTTRADGAITYVFMDWRHVGELLAAGLAVFDELKNLCVWVKGHGGQGSFYRSEHELVFVFKQGSAAHLNNFGLGAGGRTTDQRVALFRHGGFPRRPDGRAQDASDREAGRDVRGRDARLLAARLDRPRCLCRHRHHYHGGRADRPPRLLHGDRPDICRRCDFAAGRRSRSAMPSWKAPTRPSTSRARRHPPGASAAYVADPDDGSRPRTALARQRSRGAARSGREPSGKTQRKPARRKGRRAP